MPLLRGQSADAHKASRRGHGQRRRLQEGVVHATVDDAQLRPLLPVAEAIELRSAELTHSHHEARMIDLLAKSHTLGLVYIRGTVRREAERRAAKGLAQHRHGGCVGAEVRVHMVHPASQQPAQQNARLSQVGEVAQQPPLRAPPDLRREPEGPGDTEGPARQRLSTGQQERSCSNVEDHSRAHLLNAAGPLAGDHCLGTSNGEAPDHRATCLEPGDLTADEAVSRHGILIDQVRYDHELAGSRRVASGRRCRATRRRRKTRQPPGTHDRRVRCYGPHRVAPHQRVQDGLGHGPVPVGIEMVVVERHKHRGEASLPGVDPLPMPTGRVQLRGAPFCGDGRARPRAAPPGRSELSAPSARTVECHAQAQRHLRQDAESCIKRGIAHAVTEC